VHCAVIASPFGQFGTQLFLDRLHISVTNDPHCIPLPKEHRAGMVEHGGCSVIQTVTVVLAIQSMSKGSGTVRLSTPV
jgi:hypothetical protein